MCNRITNYFLFLSLAALDQFWHIDFYRSAPAYSNRSQGVGHVIAQGASTTYLSTIQFSSVSDVEHYLPNLFLTAWGGCWHWYYSRRSPSVMPPDRPSRTKYCCGSNRSAAGRALAEIAVASVPHCCRTVAPFPRAAGQTFPPGAYLSPLERGWFFLLVQYFVLDPVFRWIDYCSNIFSSYNKTSNDP